MVVFVVASIPPIVPQDPQAHDAAAFVASRHATTHATSAAADFATAAALARLEHQGPRYNAFNLLVCDGATLGIYESERRAARTKFDRAVLTSALETCRETRHALLLQY